MELDSISLMQKCIELPPYAVLCALNEYSDYNNSTVA